MLYLTDELHLLIFFSSSKQCASWTSCLFAFWLNLSNLSNESTPVSSYISKWIRGFLTCKIMKSEGGTDKRNDMSFPVIIAMKGINNAICCTSIRQVKMATPSPWSRSGFDILVSTKSFCWKTCLSQHLFLKWLLLIW